jgi:hypothetical protein
MMPRLLVLECPNAAGRPQPLSATVHEEQGRVTVRNRTRRLNKHKKYFFCDGDAYFVPLTQLSLLSPSVHRPMSQ